MKLRTKALIGAAGVLAFVSGVAVDQAHAQTAGPIETAPETGYPGCGGNSMIRDISTSADANGEWKCANKRTYRFGAQSRTVTVVATFRTNGTGSASYTLSAPVNFDVQLRVRSHVGISSDPGPLSDDVSGVLPAGSVGPVVLNFVYSCGQIDIKAVLVGEGQSAGRIAGPFICSPPQPVPTTTTATTTPPPGSSSPTSAGATSAPTSSSSSGVVGRLPDTGRGVDIKRLGLALLGAGVLALILTSRRFAR
jgi:hypothetical protein